MTPAVPDPTVEARIAEVLTGHEIVMAETAGWRCRCGFMGAWYEQRKHLAPLLAARAPDPLRDRLQALCDAAMRNNWHLGAEAVSVTVAQVLAVVGEEA